MTRARAVQERNTNNVMAKDKPSFHIQRLLSKIASKFPPTDEPEVFTDIHLRVSQDTGDVMAYDDDDKEITRVVVDEWINNPLETEEFYRQAYNVIKEAVEQGNYQLGILPPYNYVLESENGEHIAEIYVVDDDDTTILGTPIMQDMDADLDDFIKNLMKEE